MERFGLQVIRQFKEWYIEKGCVGEIKLNHNALLDLLDKEIRPRAEKLNQLRPQR